MATRKKRREIWRKAWKRVGVVVLLALGVLAITSVGGLTVSAGDYMLSVGCGRVHLSYFENGGLPFGMGQMYGDFSLGHIVPSVHSEPSRLDIFIPIWWFLFAFALIGAGVILVRAYAKARRRAW